MSDEAIKDDQQQPVEESWVPNEAQAVAALGVTEEEWKGLKAMDGFPGRDKSRGWPLHAIRAWMAEPADEDGPDGSTPPENRPPDAAAGRPLEGIRPSERPVESEDDLDIVELILPVATPREGTYIASQMGRVDVRLDRITELPGFKKLHAGLRAENVEFPNGKPVDTPQDVVRYVMLKVTEQCEAA